MRTLHQPLHMFVPNGDLNRQPHTFHLSIFQISNKQLVLFIYSARSGDTSELQRSQIALIKLGLTFRECGEGLGGGLHLETLVWLRGSKFSDRSGLNQHFQPVGNGRKAGDARSGQTAISQLGVRRKRHVGAKLVIMLQNGKQLISLNGIHQ